MKKMNKSLQSDLFGKQISQPSGATKPDALHLRAIHLKQLSIRIRDEAIKEKQQEQARSGHIV